MVSDAKEKVRILKACHDAPTSGHFGITKTWKRLAERFHWKGMYEDVKNQVRLVTMCLS